VSVKCPVCGAFGGFHLYGCSNQLESDDRIDIGSFDYPVIAQRRARALAESMAQRRKEAFRVYPPVAHHGDICYDTMILAGDDRHDPWCPTCGVVRL
jgi:hypothetical protein